MKRKIEARMKGQGQEGLAQQIAVSIIDKNAATPNITPLAQSPQSVRDSATPTEAPNPLATSAFEATPQVQVEHSTNFSTRPPASDAELITMDTIMTDVEATSEPSSRKLDAEILPILQPEDSSGDDEELRLLAELEAERLAEEAARKKRQQLEERLASARGKKSHKPHIPEIIPERDGLGQEGKVNPVQDSTSSLLE
jgi:hypothetical protein